MDIHRDGNERPGSQPGWSDGVRIREVGGPPGNQPGTSHRDTDPEAAQDGRTNRRPFMAAWILTGFMIGVGLLWISGALDDSTLPGSPGYSVTYDAATGMPVEPELPPFGAQLQYLGYLAPQILPVGLASAAALLILQGVRNSGLRPPLSPDGAP